MTLSSVLCRHCAFALRLDAPYANPMPYLWHTCVDVCCVLRWGRSCNRNWYTGNAGPLGALGPADFRVWPHFTKSAPALLGFDRNIDWHCHSTGAAEHATACVKDNMNILSLYGEQIPYNVCRNLEWQARATGTVCGRSLVYSASRAQTQGIPLRVYSAKVPQASQCTWSVSRKPAFPHCACLRYLLLSAPQPPRRNVQSGFCDLESLDTRRAHRCVQPRARYLDRGRIRLCSRSHREICRFTEATSHSGAVVRTRRRVVGTVTPQEISITWRHAAPKAMYSICTHSAYTRVM